MDRAPGLQRTTVGLNRAHWLGLIEEKRGEGKKFEYSRKTDQSGSVVPVMGSQRRSPRVELRVLLSDIIRLN